MPSRVSEGLRLKASRFAGVEAPGLGKGQYHISTVTSSHGLGLQGTDHRSLQRRCRVWPCMPLVVCLIGEADGESGEGSHCFAQDKLNSPDRMALLRSLLKTLPLMVTSHDEFQLAFSGIFL
jgi:hypothetical protein